MAAPKAGGTCEEFDTQRMDPRYPNQNQTRACYDSYCDYHKCIRLNLPSGDCDLFRRYFETICPNFWIDHWDELRARDAFPGPI